MACYRLLVREGRRSIRWPAIRAAVIAFVIVFNVIAAVPVPRQVSRDELRTPQRQTELVRWVGLFHSLGVDTEPERVADGYVDVVESAARVQNVALRPVAWWMSLTQTSQGWRLFGLPSERPHALRISVTRGGGAEVLYQSSSAHVWNADLLEYRRVRALYNPHVGVAPPTYSGFCERAGDRILSTMPDVDVVSCSLLQTHTTIPGEQPDDSVVELSPHVVTRARP